VQDPSFESGGKVWSGVSQENLAITTEQHHYGNVSLKLSAVSGETSVSQQIPIFEGVIYAISGWVMTTDASGGGAGVQVDWLNGSGDLVRQDTAGTLTGTHAWSPISGYFYAPPGARFLRIRIFAAEGTSTAYVDDIIVRQL
jgi:hypothetical protein